MKNNNWQIKYLKDLCIQAGEYGLNAPAISFTKEFPLYLRITDITDDGIYSDKQRVSVAYTGTEKLLNNNDFLFARTGATVGKTYLNRQTDEKIAFAGYLIRFVPDLNKILPYYLVLYCQTKPYWKWVKIFSIRSGQPGISAEEYGKLPIPCPPIEEQRRIVEVLECWDKGIELVKKLIEQKELQKKYLMQQLLSGTRRFKGFTQKWETARISEIKDIIIEKGHSLTKQEVIPGNIPVIAGGQTVPFFHNKWTHNFPCITISASGAYAGYVWKHTQKIYASDCNVLYSNNYNLDFLYYVLKYNQNYLYYIQTGGAQGHIYASEIGHISIPFINAREQQAIAEVLSSADKEIDLLKQKLAKLEAQKKGLMQVLLTGKIRLK